MCSAFRPTSKPPLTVNRVVHVAGSRRERDTAVRFLAERFLSMYGRRGHDDVRQLGTQDRAGEETARQHFITGEASECVEQILQYEALGIRRIVCAMNFGKLPLDLVDASLRRFGAEVLPRFQ